MTNNHCPERPARILLSVNGEKAIQEFAVKIETMISQFADENSMDEMLILDPRIVDDWTECRRCESLITDMHGNAYGMVIQRIMNHLNEEF